jgi:hypothetical protein
VEMKQVRLGQVDFTIQNDNTFNQDVYIIAGNQLQESGIHDVKALNRLIHEQVGEPERFIVNAEGSQNEVYTKQPDAVISLALVLNQLQNTAVPDQEIEQIRDYLIRLQN